LSLAGAKVLMLEAGRNYDPVAETPMLNTHAQAPLRGAGTPDKPFGSMTPRWMAGGRFPKEPYLVRRNRRDPNGWYEATDISLSTYGPEFHVVAPSDARRSN
jgi:choline dehydrogenase-like flavoprotein